MKLYAIEYVSGGYSDGFTLGEIFKEITSQQVRNCYGGVKRWFPLDNEHTAEIMKWRTIKTRHSYKTIAE